MDLTALTGTESCSSLTESSPWGAGRTESKLICLFEPSFWESRERTAAEFTALCSVPLSQEGQTSLGCPAGGKTPRSRLCPSPAVKSTGRLHVPVHWAASEPSCHPKRPGHPDEGRCPPRAPGRSTPPPWRCHLQNQHGDTVAEQVCCRDSRGAGQGARRPEQKPCSGHLYSEREDSSRWALKGCGSPARSPPSDRRQGGVPLASDIKTDLGPPPRN